jgi:hypothetical protein
MPSSSSVSLSVVEQVPVFRSWRPPGKLICPGWWRRALRASAAVQALGALHQGDQHGGRFEPGQCQVMGGGGALQKAGQQLGIVISMVSLCRPRRAGWGQRASSSGRMRATLS